MGVLYRAATMKSHFKRDAVLDRLKDLGISYSRTGIPVSQLNYKDLKYELALAEITRAERSQTYVNHKR